MPPIPGPYPPWMVINLVPGLSGSAAETGFTDRKRAAKNAARRGKILFILVKFSSQFRVGRLQEIRLRKKSHYTVGRIIKDSNPLRIFTGVHRFEIHGYRIPPPRRKRLCRIIYRYTRTMTNYLIYDKCGQSCIFIDKAINVGGISLIDCITVIDRLSLEKNIRAIVDSGLCT